MRTIKERLKLQGLFIKLFAVMVISIVVVAVASSWTTVRMSERLFMNTFSITNGKVIGQIKTNFETFHNSIITAMNNVQQSGNIKTFLTTGDTDSLTMVKAYYNMTQQMKKIQSNVEAYPVGIAIIGKNNRYYSSNMTNFSISAAELKNHPMTARAVDEPRQLMYQMYQPLDTGVASDNFIVATKALLERTTGDIYGMLYIVIKEKDFMSFYSSFTSKGNDVAILNSAGTIVSSNRQELIGQEDPDLLKRAKEVQEGGLHYKKVKVMGEEQILISDYLPSYDFYVVNLIDKKLALGQIINTRTVFTICVVIVALALIIVFIISRRLTRSLTLLARQMQKVTKRNFHNYITATGSYEIRELAKAFNYMLDEVNEYVHQLVETQKGQRNAELTALQRQINPHFLYNTLATVKFLVQQGSKEKAVETIHAMISLLQNSISNVNETITIEEEMANLKHYVFINHVRYGERINVYFFVSPDCRECHVPKLIIQPFIENAFFHGFNIKQEGYIHVMVAREGGTLVCEVADNGDGMEGISSDNALPNAKSKSQLFTGIGIKNVHDRIVLLYGEDYGVSITSELGKGTQVKIRLPVLDSQK
ncbi:cache domain-containing sensor histidine kinase [Gorillibacterium massiliense]|uniref:cache domain-containing sensor histidine kinase n=1 Tax=Gorillibacterium massiliense TaxID=1280390 RepID=UPI0004ADD178|nr:sensor histidine kinase [Gorillibacterium massiliense]